MNVSDKGLCPDKNLRVFLPTIDSGNIGLDGVSSYRFITSSYVDRRIWRFKTFAKNGIKRHPCILGGDLESLFDNVGWKPGETRTKGIIITWCLRYLVWSMVTWTSICVRVCIHMADITMSISPEDTTVGSRLNIHVSVIMSVGVRVKGPWEAWLTNSYCYLSG
jgi:hypothetical protein